MTHAVSGLFGAMVALAIYTRAGGLATVMVAAGILVVYILIEMYRGWRELLEARADRGKAHFRWSAWDYHDFAARMPERLKRMGRR